MKRFILSLIIFMIVAGACEKNTAPPVGGAVAEINVIEVKYLHLTSQVNEHAFIAEYNATNTDGIKIVADQVDFSELDKRILLAGQVNNAYDIIMTNHSSVSQFVSAGILEPLDDYISAAGIDLSTYQSEAVNIGKINGRQMAIPYDPDCRVLAINTKVFAKAGLTEADYPKTLDELLDVSHKIKQADPDLYSFASIYFRNWTPIYEFGCFMLGGGGHLYKEQNGFYKATVDSPAVIDFVEWSRELYPTMVMDANVNENRVRELFMQNRTAFMVFGPWELKLQSNRIKSGEVVLTLIPSGSVKSGSAMGGWMLSMGASSKKKDSAWKFIAEVNKPENMAKFCQSLPANTESFKYPPFNNPVYAIFDDQFKTAEYPAPPISVYSRIADIFNKYYLQAITGDISANEACEKAQEEIQYELDNM